MSAPEPQPTGDGAPAWPPASSPRTASVRGLALLVAAVLVLGAALGVVWSRLAPGQRFVVIDARTLATLPTESEHVFVDAALFVVLGLVGGLLSAVAAWRWRRARGPVVLLVLVGASVLGALLAHVVGLALVTQPDATGAPQGTVLTAAPQLRTWLVLVGQPLGAALGYGGAVSLSSDELEPETAGLSSASPARPAGPAEPGPPAAR